ncbi:hypothetical protein BC834DRAFT_438280 [Gloeopeniophorella convolvens]|nr:hypothetical protein BC834DRAFT_438280 [Gloeopeniophorella convolvens]
MKPSPLVLLLLRLVMMERASSSLSPSSLMVLSNSQGAVRRRLEAVLEMSSCLDSRMIRPGGFGGKRILCGDSEVKWGWAGVEMGRVGREMSVAVDGGRVRELCERRKPAVAGIGSSGSLVEEATEVVRLRGRRRVHRGRVRARRASFAQTPRQQVTYVPSHQHVTDTISLSRRTAGRITPVYIG